MINASVRPPTSEQLSSGSVLSRRAFVNFGKEEERDAALQEVNTCACLFAAAHVGAADSAGASRPCLSRLCNFDRRQRAANPVLCR